MTLAESIIFGIVQGLSEFLPVSSSGHLVILHQFFGNTAGDLSFDILLHMATLLAVLVYFRKDIFYVVETLWRLVLRKPVEKKDIQLIIALLVGTIPAGLLGALFASDIENMFRSSFSVAIALIAGSILFIVAESVRKEHRTIGGKRGFWVGCFQALALIPGISRSGSTISGGLILGFTRGEAVRFSFLLAIPIILGAGIVKLGGAEMLVFSVPVILGALSAFLSGLLAIHVLIKFLKKHTLMPFVWYRILLAILILVMF